VEGIWSEEEDKMLEGGNARALRKLEEKHGWKECEERLKFLEDWREGSDDEDEE
jgi:telomeric repeat-binding factor 2-interacting protein 1